LAEQYCGQASAKSEDHRLARNGRKVSEACPACNRRWFGCWIAVALQPHSIARLQFSHSNGVVPNASANSIAVSVVISFLLFKISETA